MNLGNCLFQSCCIPCLENDTALACYIFDIHQPILIIFVDNKVVLLGAVCKYYFSSSHFVFEARYTLQRDWKDTIWGVHVSPGRAETLVRKGGTANDHLIAYSLSNVSVKNSWNSLLSVEGIVCYITVVLDTVCVEQTLDWYCFNAIHVIKGWQNQRSQQAKRLCSKCPPSHALLSHWSTVMSTVDCSRRHQTSISLCFISE